jgi:hypothetical protein
MDRQKVEGYGYFPIPESGSVDVEVKTWKPQVRDRVIIFIIIVIASLILKSNLILTLNLFYLSLTSGKFEQ